MQYFHRLSLNQKYILLHVFFFGGGVESFLHEGFQLNETAYGAFVSKTWLIFDKITAGKRFLMRSIKINISYSGVLLYYVSCYVWWFGSTMSLLSVLLDLLMVGVGLVYFFDWNFFKEDLLSILVVDFSLVLSFWMSLFWLDFCVCFWLCFQIIKSISFICSLDCWIFFFGGGGGERYLLFWSFSITLWGSVVFCSEAG